MKQDECMNICFLIRRFDFGGAENYVREHANSFAETGNTVYVFSRKGRQQRLLSPKVKFCRLHLSKWFLPINLLHLIFLAKKYKIDIIHAQQASAIRAGSWLGKITGIPVIVTIHSTTPLELNSELTRSLPTRIIYISRFTMERSEWFSTLRPKCRYIPNGIVPRDYQTPPISARLVYCSRLDKRHAKFLKLMITEVLPQLKVKIPHLTLEILGDGRWHNQIAIWAKQINWSLGSTIVTLAGFQEQFTTNGFLVIGVGRVALEALSTGIPVLAINANRCGPRISSENYEILRQNNFVDVSAPKPNAEMIIETITKIYVNYQEIVADSLYLREKINSDFCFANLVDQLQREYQEIINERCHIANVCLKKSSRYTHPCVPIPDNPRL